MNADAVKAVRHIALAAATELKYGDQEPEAAADAIAYAAVAAAEPIICAEVERLREDLAQSTRAIDAYVGALGHENALRAEVERLRDALVAAPEKVRALCAAADDSDYTTMFARAIERALDGLLDEDAR